MNLVISIGKPMFRLTNMSTKNLKNKRNLTLPSEPESINRLEPFLVECHKPLAKQKKLFYDILFVLTEAVNNGIIHGNERNPSKKVTVQFFSTGKTLNFTVSDEGRGFNSNSIPDPTHQSRIDEPNGRGVFLMKKIAHKLDFSDNGRRVLIQFELNK